MQTRFKQLLEEKQLTATRFATMIKVNASAMSHILNGRSKPGFDVLDKIAQAFPDVNLNWLISGKGSMSNTDQPKQMELFQKEEEEKSEQPESVSTSQESPLSSIATTVESLPDRQKKLKRVILFFEDGSFEDYGK